MWAAATLGFAAVSARWPDSARGGSASGLVFGVGGFSLMAFAGLLSVRKRFPAAWAGRVQTWMRGHLSLGLLSFFLILYHAGFSFGGPLTSLLMWLFAAVLVSGVYGAILQQVLPRMMLQQVPMETIYEQIPHVRRRLAEECDWLVGEACGTLDVQAAAVAHAGEISGSRAGLPSDDAAAPLRTFYLQDLRAFVASPGTTARLTDPRYSRRQFDRLRALLPASLHTTVGRLERICEEERQLSRQVRLHHLLHGWLLVHVPLSLALLTLTVVHVAMALRY